jgi:GNAT superfamily N-acetyltransferase
MGLSTSFSRISEYYKRHGFAETVRRAAVAAQRALFANRMVVYSCDLGKQREAALNVPDPLRIERVRSEGELSAQDREAITSFWNPELARKNIRDRFEKGASLWVIRSGEALAGYGWTLRGSTMEPYFFPLRPDDVHLFDFHVLAEFRGRGLNPLLVKCILKGLAGECAGRALIEAAEWNQAQLSSLRKTPFLRLGMVRSFTVLGHTFTHWSEKSATEESEDVTSGVSDSPAMARPHER